MAGRGGEPATAAAVGGGGVGGAGHHEPYTAPLLTPYVVAVLAVVRTLVEQPPAETRWPHLVLDLIRVRPLQGRLRETRRMHSRPHPAVGRLVMPRT